MKIKYIKHNSIEIAVVQGEEVIISDVQSALDLMATVRYGNECDRIAIPKTVITRFFCFIHTACR